MYEKPNYELTLKTSQITLVTTTIPLRVCHFKEVYNGDSRERKQINNNFFHHIRMSLFTYVFKFETNIYWKVGRE